MSSPNAKTETPKKEQNVEQTKKEQKKEQPISKPTPVPLSRHQKMKQSSSEFEKNVEKRGLVSKKKEQPLGVSSVVVGFLVVLVVGSGIFIRNYEVILSLTFSVYANISRTLDCSLCSLQQNLFI